MDIPEFNKELSIKIGILETLKLELKNYSQVWQYDAILSGMIEGHKATYNSLNKNKDE